MIAGEASGDVLGASLMRGLKEQGLGPEDMSGIGGKDMAAEGLESLIPMDELCVMGVWEVAGHLPRLLRLINGIVEEIERRKPDVVVTIDLPDFNFEVAKRLKKRGRYRGKIVHYVAPSVWAWRPGRAKQVAQYLDGMMCLFPFEPDYFKPHGLRAEYVGHPLVEIDKSGLEPQRFRASRQIEQERLCVGAFFGSRERELKAHAGVILDTLDVLREQHPELEVIVPTLPQVEYEVLRLVDRLGGSVHVVTEQDQKWNAFAACDVAVAVSGTVGLELAYIGVPHVIGYKAHPLTAFVVKRMAQVRNVHLANILLKEDVVPEFLQGQCNPNNLVRAMMRLIRYPEEREKQLSSFKKLENMLKLDSGQTPSKRAASFVLAA